MNEILEHITKRAAELLRAVANLTDRDIAELHEIHRRLDAMSERADPARVFPEGDDFG